MSENWKINDTAVAICNVYLFMADASGKDTEKKLISRDQEFTVKDVKSMYCISILDVGISRTKSEVIHYYCNDCKEIHVVKTNKESNIYFPSIWFRKPEKNTLKEKLKRIFGLKKQKVESDKILIRKPEKTQTPVEVPKRIHRKDREIEIVE
jgi:hypothetical protein